MKEIVASASDMFVKQKIHCLSLSLTRYAECWLCWLFFFFFLIKDCLCIKVASEKEL